LLELLFFGFLFLEGEALPGRLAKALLRLRPWGEVGLRGERLDFFVDGARFPFCGVTPRVGFFAGVLEAFRERACTCLSLLSSVQSWRVS